MDQYFYLIFNMKIIVQQFLLDISIFAQKTNQRPESKTMRHSSIVVLILATLVASFLLIEAQKQPSFADVNTEAQDRFLSSQASAIFSHGNKAQQLRDLQGNSKKSPTASPSVSQAPIIPPALPYENLVCDGVFTSRAQMKRVNYAKSIGEGNFNCLTTLTFRSANGGVLQLLAYNSTVQTSYNNATGSMDSYSVDPVLGVSIIQEFWQPRSIHSDKVCILVNSMDPLTHYGESFDVTTGSWQAAARFISYRAANDPDEKVFAFQDLKISEDGVIVTFKGYDTNGHLSFTYEQTCVGPKAPFF